MSRDIDNQSAADLGHADAQRTQKRYLMPNGGRGIDEQVAAAFGHADAAGTERHYMTPKPPANGDTDN